ncbi:tRNA-dihydrouridine synthase DusB [hydrothermal vent metagenome]|uniref:tRNA-dihydrouridine synthase DusB n=1 Tax=hydrothermal vent metagenome TaxID=652676 RepID=A0A3B1BXI9_9ZZZZ
MRIGEIKIGSRAVMAPIAGITDRPFRALVMEYGAGMVTSELLSANALVHESEKTTGMLPQPGEPRPVAAQIFGGEPDILMEAAKIVDETDCDIIDLNFGCPVKKVTKTGGGAALLTDIKKAERITAVVSKAVKKPVTVKIRTGWDKKSVNAVEMAKSLEGAGAAAITVHGRYASQGYSGLADWGLISKVAESVDIPVIGNGDIRTCEQAASLLESSGCAFVMIGRGALGAPWIFRQFNEYNSAGSFGKITVGEMETVILRHLDMMTVYYGERRAVRKIRTLIGYYTKGIQGGARFREAANKTADKNSLKRLITGFFAQSGEAVLT